ncbi:MAG TPA: molybdate ABC transporter substrate-binding protein [Methylomirabilota bacterium]|jgi:molybdate transport system substrate-binding protein|nr:molybdate ABC transporter substrate-binding protein [Methylomirabilota bacterium]
MRVLLALTVAALTAVGVAEPAPRELTLSVAVSLKEAVEELGRRFVPAHAGVTLRYNFGASGELARQIEAGAPIDLFLSAGERQMDDLERHGLVVRATRRVLARNVLVAVKPVDSRLDLAKPADLLDARVGRVVVGNPKTVPAGQYAEQSLRVLGLWGPLGPRLIFAENVRQALEYVARGEVDVGFVYASDLASRPGRVREAFRPGEDTYSPIVYPAAVVTGAHEPALAEAFIGLLRSAEGQAVLARFGFQPAVR